MCQRSYFSFNLMAKENQIKAFVGQDEQRNINKEDSGLRRVEQNGSTRKSVIANAHGFQAKLANNQSQGSILDSVLDGSVHVGNKDRTQEASLTKLDELN